MSGPGRFILSYPRRLHGGEQGKRFQPVVEGTLDVRAVSRGPGPPRLALFGMMGLPTLNPNMPTVL